MFDDICRVIELVVFSATAGGTFYACYIAVNNERRNTEKQTALTILNCIVEAAKAVRQNGELNTALYDNTYAHQQDYPEAKKEQCDAFFRSRPDVVHLLYLLNILAVFLSQCTHIKKNNFTVMISVFLDEKTLLWLGRMAYFGNLSTELCLFLGNEKGE